MEAANPNQGWTHDNPRIIAKVTKKEVITTMRVVIMPAIFGLVKAFRVTFSVK